MDKNHDRLTQSDLDRFIIAFTEEANERLKAINDNLPYDGNLLANFGLVFSLLGKKDNFLLSLLDKTVTLEALNGISKLNKNNIDFTNLNEEEIIQTIIKRYNLNNLKSIKDIIFNLLTLRQIPTLYYLNEYYNYYRDKPSVKDYESINQPNLLRYYDRDLKNNYGLIKLRPETIVYISQIPPRIYDLEKNITVFTYTEKKLTDLFNFLYINNPQMVISYRGKDCEILPFKMDKSYLTEEMAFGKPFELDIDKLPAISQFCSYSEKNDLLSIKVTKQDITFEELLDDFIVSNDQIITQVIHLTYYLDKDNTYKINHLDHEYIYYDLDSYTKRFEDVEIKGAARPRLKTFKLDKCSIPFDYPCMVEEGEEKFVPFLYYVLNHYFKNKKLLKEYFNKILS